MQPPTKFAVMRFNRLWRSETPEQRCRRLQRLIDDIESDMLAEWHAQPWARPGLPTTPPPRRWWHIFKRDAAAHSAAQP